MPEYLRHKNGGGKIFDADVCAETFLDRKSVVYQNSDVVQSRIINSQIHDAVIVRSRIEDCLIAGTTITNADIFKSQIACDVVLGDVVIKNSILSGETRVTGRAIILRSNVRDFLITGTACLDGVIIDNGLFGRVSRGTWTRSPRIQRFEDLAVTVTESVKGFAFVGCQEKPLKFWFNRGGARFGRANGWTNEQIERLRDLLNDWDKNDA